MTRLIVTYWVLVFRKAFFAWLSSNQYEQFMIYNRMFGPYWPFYWSLILATS